MYDFAKISADDRYKNGSAEYKQMVKDIYARDYWAELSSDERFKSLTRNEQKEYEKHFDSLFANGRKIRNEIDGPGRSFGENMLNLTKESFVRVGDSIRLADNIASGDFDDTSAGIMASSIKRSGEQYIPDELMATQKTLQGIGERYDQAKGFTETAGAIGHGIYDTAKEVVANPKGVAYLTAQSLGNSAPVIGGQVAGAATGMAASGPLPIPHLKIAGGLAGAFMGGMTAEMAPKFEEILLEELQSRGLPPTEANIQTLLNDERWTLDALKRARLKGAGTAGVDSALGVGIGRLGTAPARQATAEVTQRLGAGATKEAVNAGVKEALGSRPLGSKLATGAKTYGAEVASEPASEAAGQLAADGGIDLGELAGETLGGIGHSTLTTPADIYAFGSDYKAAMDLKNNPRQTATNNPPVDSPESAPPATVPSPSGPLEKAVLTTIGIGRQEQPELSSGWMRKDPWKNYDEDVGQFIEDAAFAAGRENSFNQMVAANNRAKLAENTTGRPSTAEEAARVFEQSQPTQAMRQAEERESIGDAFRSVQPWMTDEDIKRRGAEILHDSMPKNGAVSYTHLTLPTKRIV